MFTVLIMTGLALHIATPGEMRAGLQVIHIALVGIGLTLKRDIPVGIAAHRQAHQPFAQISDEEEHEQHLALLRRVDSFVVHHLVAQVNPGMHKQHTQQVDGREALEWQYRSPHNFHNGKGTTNFWNAKPSVSQHAGTAHRQLAFSTFRLKKEPKTIIYCLFYCNTHKLQYLCRYKKRFLDPNLIKLCNKL